MFGVNDKEEKREELSIFQLARKFPNDLAAEKWFEEIRWTNGQLLGGRSVNSWPVRT